jgi:gluconolactonase
MPRVALDLNKEADRQKVKGVWRRALGLVPGEPNQGLVAELESSPARLADYDDSGWEITDNVRDLVSKGFTFGWWRITVELPEQLEGIPIAGSNVLFETNIDNYGEVWVDGDLDLVNGTVVGFNAQQRVVVSPSAVPGAKHVIACLAANGPLALPRGVIFMRYATLAFETRG